MSKKKENNPENNNEPAQPKTDNKKVSMETLTSSEELPDVQEHAISAVKNEAESVAAEVKKEHPDFDPAIHETDANGKPVLTLAGKPRKKRGAGSPKHKQSQIGISKQKQQEKTPENERGKVHVSSEVAAKTTSTVLERLQCVMISDDMKYSDLEREGNIKAWSDLYDHYGGLEVHPAAAVAADHLMIIASRAQKPKVQSKFKKLTEQIAGKIALWKGRKNAWINRGQDPERKDDVRKEESGSA